MEKFMQPIDWICWGMYFILGTWKLWELLSKFGRWLERKIEK